MFLHNKLIINTRSTKNQENSAHHFVENYLTNHLAKFLRDRISEYALVITFFKENREGFLTFNFSRGSC